MEVQGMTEQDSWEQSLIGRMALDEATQHDEKMLHCRTGDA